MPKRNFATVLLLLLVSCLRPSQAQARALKLENLGFDAGAGLLYSSTSLTTLTSKAGIAGFGVASLGTRLGSAHVLDFSLGAQVNWATGSNAYRDQSIVQLSVSPSAHYRYALLDWLEVGASLKAQLGSGANLDFADLTSFQVCPGFGPEAVLRLSGQGFDWLIGVSAQWLFTTANQVRVEIPIYAGVRFKLQKEKDAEAPVPQEPAPAASPKGSEDIAAGEVAQLIPPDGVKVTLPVSRVSFATAEAAISSAGREYLAALAQVFVEQDAGWEQLEVSGHTDKRGTEERNALLSRRRASAVVEALTQAGVGPGKITSRGAGSSEPLDDRDEEEAWRRNRRVEIKVTGSKEPARLARALNEVDRRLQSAANGELGAVKLPR